VKETRQVLRDPSSIAIGIVLPVILILLFGFGLSLDVKNVPLAVVLEDSSYDASELIGSFQLSAYFRPQITHSMPAAQALMIEGRVDGIVRIPRIRASREREQSEIQVLVHGGDANRARIIQGYVAGAVATGPRAKPRKARRWWPSRSECRPACGSMMQRQPLLLVPGLIVLVMTLIGVCSPHGDGARVGARHVGGAVRHAGAQR